MIARFNWFHVPLLMLAVNSAAIAQPAATKSAPDEIFASVPTSRQAALEAFAKLKKRIGPKIYFAKDGVTVSEARFGFGGVNENMFRALKWFPEIQRVSVRYRELQDDWLVHLKPLVNLNRVGFTHSPVGDAGFKHLEGLKNLESVHASNTKITDSGVASLVKLKKLQGLVLMHTQVTDKGLATLEQLASLRVLSLRGSRVTQEGIDRFKKARPECKVLRIQ